MDKDRVRCAAGAVLMAAALHAAAADPRADYERRAAERDVSLFRLLDRDGDGAVSRLEAQGDLDFGPRFDDMDINRDGFVTSAELQRYIEQQFGVRLEIPMR
jgi:hypothetical protein